MLKAIYTVGNTEVSYPKTQKAELFIELLNDKVNKPDGIGVSRMVAMRETWILNVPDVIMQIRKAIQLIPEVDVVTNMIDVTNKYGRSIKYGRYRLVGDNKLLFDIYENTINKGRS